jgi:hypothetical protein
MTKKLVTTTLILALVCIILLFVGHGCGNGPSEGQGSPNDTTKYVFQSVNDSANGWNVLFQPGSTFAEREATILHLEANIRALYKAHPEYTFHFKAVYCPCDSLLTNLTYTILGGVGQSVTPPPKQNPPPGAQGDPIATVTYNNSIASDKDIRRFSDTGKKYSPNTDMNVAKGHILAVLDTGLDTAYFSPAIGKLIWQEPGGRTLYNFLAEPAGDRHTLVDDHPHKHGSFVTALALQAMKGPLYPEIMVLKVLDANNEGSTFTVSCGISYAIQHQATVVNASLGYFADPSVPPDEVLRHYVKLTGQAAPHPILFLAAAGNEPTPPAHADSLLCTPSPASNYLSKTHEFLPACYSTDLTNVLGITGITNLGWPGKLEYGCRYQNYSEKYVSVGVVNRRRCCSYTAPSFTDVYEGSSFATGVFSGYLVDNMLNHGWDINKPGFLSLKTQKSTLLSHKTTKDGLYIINPTE